MSQAPILDHCSHHSYQHIAVVMGEILRCAGEIPSELEGTLLRNGPGLFEVGGKGISQPLDGDGMVRKFRCFGSLSALCDEHPAEYLFVTGP